MAYDPKRPRPRVAEEATAPVDALLDEPSGSNHREEPEAPTPHLSAVDDTDLDVVEDHVEAPSKDNQPGATHPSSRSDTPTAPAPESGTANVAVVVAGIAALVAAIVVLAVWLRRRR